MCIYIYTIIYIIYVNVCVYIYCIYNIYGARSASFFLAVAKTMALISRPFVSPNAVKLLKQRSHGRDLLDFSTPFISSW